MLSPAGTSTPVTFGDTKEGLFGIRLRDELRESDGSVVTSSAGAVGSEAAYGYEARAFAAFAAAAVHAQ